MEAEQGEPVEIAGLQLRFQPRGEYVEVIDAKTGAWVANVTAFHRTDNRPVIRHSYAYRDRLGRGDNDRHGAAERRAIAAHAALIYKDTR